MKCFTGHRCTPLSLCIARCTQTRSEGVLEVLSFYVPVSLLTSTPLQKAASLEFVTEGAIYRAAMFAIDSSPHRILDTFLKKRSSLITGLCPTLVRLTLSFLCGTQLWSCEIEYTWRIKGLLSGPCFWWNLKNEAQEG